MIHPEHLRPPPHDHPADDWNIVEKGCQSVPRPAWGALALGKRRPRTRGCPEASSPDAEAGARIRGLCQIRPTLYGEEPRGLRRTPWPNRSTSRADSALRRRTPTEPPRKAGFHV